ncbi:hypothetical protein N7489_011959 [Penicillium chrysogenum]|uniref:Xylanolytic transcriptional activator regulatory domain-containing protein n=1 Tax=Penicillium chrysogenum TaxID=5076 RepID=A0ABQ8W131_PENCH|nr:uncharacterized protein N7489_011959 [Penicillium chrysogenum]KAJ5231251.1 hypothetical protein N7489_011959 [Penicillium chrysogenum]KAJ5253577.1 hypothetical protein N7505_012240 [Penicillium chrysogenum]
MSPQRPAFDDLPLRKDGPPGNAWGMFGDQDQMGMLNLLTPENTAAAAREIVDGVRVSTDWALNSMATPCFGRSAFEHIVKNKAPRVVNDDILIFNTQSSSQWDGFRHYGSKQGTYFNGCTQDDIQNSTRNGIHVWVENGGVVGRGVLLDYAGWAAANGKEVKCFETQSIPASVLQEVATSQNTTFRPGDILFIRTGWTRAYEQLSRAECQQLADYAAPPVIGVESSEAMLRWIWDRELAAVVGDMPSFEAYPCQNQAFFLHEWLLAGWGVPIGELFDLEQLSQECRKRNRWTFFFSSVPLKVPGGLQAPRMAWLYFDQDYYRQLQAQAPASREGSHSTPSSEPSISNRYSHEGPPERDDWWYKGTDNLFLNRSGEHHFVGASSTTHLAKRLNPGSANLAWDVRPLYDDPSSLRRPVGGSLPQLPPFEFAKRLFWVQYAYIGTIFSLIKPLEFEARLDLVYHQPLDFSHRESCLVYCQTLLVISFGLMYSVNQWIGEEGPPGFKYFKHALRFLPDIHEEGSILFVEVLCYVAYYMQNLNRRDAAFLYIGLALRMAISLGLHQEVSDPSISEPDRNRRRRAWWSVYSLDRLLSVKSGNPITIHDEDIGITWPTDVGGSTFDMATSEIYRKKPGSGSNLIASVQSITNDLSAWLRQVPDRLRIDFTTLDTHINRESVSINLHFYSCVNMTARPLVFYVIQRRLDAEALGSTTEDWKEGLAPNTVAVIDSCITAARATTMIMDAAAKHNLVATYGYLDGEYIFSAALLLVMVNAAFPPNETSAWAMETALNLLRGMADRGNTYLDSRHSLLLELWAAIGPRRAEEKDTDAASSLAAGQNGPVTPMSENAANPSEDVPDPSAESAASQVPTYNWPQQPDIPSFRDIAFQFDLNDDPALWEGALDQIDIDMDTDWIENTLKR